MRTLRPIALASVALAAFAAGTAAGIAQDKPGVARISDTLRPAAEPNPLPVQTVSSSRTIFSSGGNCPAGVCDAGVCERGYPEQYYNRRWFRHGVYRQRLRWDYVRGPAIHAAYREPVSYQHWLPDVWYGDPRYGVPAGFPVPPMVYMPTDTTQLGYYYHRVPTWIPKPCMIPPYPLPSNYHRINRPATANGCGCGCGQSNCNCQSGTGGCPQGVCGTTNGTPSAAANYPTPATAGQNASAGVPPQPKSVK